MSSISSINISKVSQPLSFNAVNANQQNNQNGLSNTQSSQLVANISKTVTESESSKMQSSDKKNIQMEKRSESSFGSKDQEDDKNTDEQPVKRLNTKV